GWECRNPPGSVHGGAQPWQREVGGNQVVSNQGAGQIEIVGLGPGDPDLRTVGAQRLLDEAEHIVLRTARHPGIADLSADARVTVCDDLYESGATFAEVYQAVAERVADLAASATGTGTVVYAVPGDPQFGERTV